MNRRELFKFFHLCVLEKSAIQHVLHLDLLTMNLNYFSLKNL